MLHSLFQNKSQVDVATVLMLLGESTIWKAVWSRIRGRRLHWTHFAFAVSPGWAPLAGTVFTAAGGGNAGERPVNLVLDMVPAGCHVPGLLLTNLSSGATHEAQNAMLQNVWLTWSRGIERDGSAGDDSSSHKKYLKKEVGLMDVDLDKLTLVKGRAVALQTVCLVVQLAIAATALAIGLSAELFVVVGITFLSQVLLVIAVTPSQTAWPKATRGYRSTPVLLHRGLDSTKALIVLRTFQAGKEISLEEFCWDVHGRSRRQDFLKTLCAASAFLLSAFAILLISWMSSQSRILYLATGSVGLLANTIDALLQPRWAENLDTAFSGMRRCVPNNSGLLGCVGVLEAARFPAATKAAACLYPNNERFADTLDALRNGLDGMLCTNCREAVRTGTTERSLSHMCWRTINEPKDCATLLAENAKRCKSKQLYDAYISIRNVLTSISAQGMRYTDAFEGSSWDWHQWGKP